jgi:hypothetical protein
VINFTLIIEEIQGDKYLFVQYFVSILSKVSLYES